MSLAFANNLPGIDTAVQTVENEYNWGPAFPWQCIGVTLNSAAVDSGNTPTTVLRRGLVLGQITATLDYKQYDPTASDGSQFPVGILDTTTDMLDPRTAATRAKYAQMKIAGFIKPTSCFVGSGTMDENTRVALRHRFVYDDLRMPNGISPIVAKSADYTLLVADNGKTFSTRGAGAPVNFTLPAIGTRGLRYTFVNEADQNMTITAPANKLVIFNNLTATSGAFSTGGNKIGASAEVYANDDATKYIFVPRGANTLTVA